MTPQRAPTSRVPRRGVRPPTSEVVAPTGLESQMAALAEAVGQMAGYQQTVIQHVRDLSSRVVDTNARQSRSSRHRQKKQKFYAVAKGRQTGVYDTWEEARRQVDGYSGSLHMSFKERQLAEDWVLACNLNSESDSDSQESSSSNGADGPPAPPPARRPTNTGRPSFVPGIQGRPGINHDPSASIPSEPRFQRYTRDPSIGEGAGHLFDVGIQMERTVLDHLCPTGISAEMKQQLADSIVDATALPGTYISTDDKTEALDSLSAAFVTALGTTTKSALWKKSSRNTLGHIKTEEKLVEVIEDFEEIRDDAVTNMQSDMRSALDALCWPLTEVETYTMDGGLALIGRWSMDYFGALLIQSSLRIASHGWDMIKADLKFYANDLGRIRQTSGTRFMHLCRTYIYLRDAKRQNFMTPKQTANRLKTLNKKFETHFATDVPSGTTERRSCGHCGAKFHTGGYRYCPFKQWPKPNARVMGRECQTRMDGGTGRESAITELKTEHAAERTPADNAGNGT